MVTFAKRFGIVRIYGPELTGSGYFLVFLPQHSFCYAYYVCVYKLSFTGFMHVLYIYTTYNNK